MKALLLALLGLAVGASDAQNAAQSPAPSAAQKIALTGVLGDKALLVVDGAPPKAVAVGESHQGVKVLQVSGEVATLQVNNQRFSQRVGDAPVSQGATAREAGGQKIVLQAQSGGHYMSLGRINGQSVQFMVDTGATIIAMGQQDAERMGLVYRKGEAFRAGTANGAVTGWRVKLDAVSIGDVTVYDVEAAVIPAPMPHILLGNSFLSRFQMRIENDQLTMVKRY